MLVSLIKIIVANKNKKEGREGVTYIDTLRKHVSRNSL
jgi:hypothetical protein